MKTFVNGVEKREEEKMVLIKKVMNKDMCMYNFLIVSDARNAICTYTYVCTYVQFSAARAMYCKTHLLLKIVRINNRTGKQAGRQAGRPCL